MSLLENFSTNFYYCELKTAVAGFKNYKCIGCGVASLDEYFIINKSRDFFKLYKTNAGNWFDFPRVNSSDNYFFLRQLKAALDNQNLE